MPFPRRQDLDEKTADMVAEYNAGASLRALMAKYGGSIGTVRARVASGTRIRTKTEVRNRKAAS